MRPSFPWEDLLVQIEDRRVIPVVGPDLLTVQSGERTVLLGHHLASKLAARLEVDTATLPEGFGLHDVGSSYLSQHGRPQRLYSRLKAIVDEEPVAPSESLKKLAAITDFDLFVSTTFDGLLADAIDEVRFGRAAQTERLAFSPSLRLQDLGCGKKELRSPTVYQIFGPLTSSTDYAVTEEDMLEFINALQTVERRPKLLFDELRSNHLLLIGCSYSNWLQRFFLRTVRNERLSLGTMSETIADDLTASDQPLVRFLQQHCTADVFHEGGAVAFVDELHRRWQLAQPCDPAPRQSVAASTVEAMSDDAVFISYAREDVGRVLALVEGLRSVGLDVWFDVRDIEPGDDWDREIRRNIKTCSLFLPIISRCSTEKLEGYFRKEWRWAIDRALGMDDSLALILPIALDGLTASVDGIPEYFQSRQWQQFPDATPSTEFLELVRSLVRALRLRKAGVLR